MSHPIKAYSYIRFSTPQAGAGDSYRRQLQQAMGLLCWSNNLQLDDKTIDDFGTSAFRGAKYV